MVFRSRAASFVVANLIVRSIAVRSLRVPRTVCTAARRRRYRRASCAGYSTAANSEGTSLQGFEIAYQQSFSDLPGFWANFGFNANYSYVDAETTVVRSGQPVDVPLAGMSNNSWNGTLFYETPRWGSRVSVNNRDDYVTNNVGGNGNISEGTTGPIRWDMSAFVHVLKHFSVTLEGINLTDEAERLFTTGDGTMNLMREINYSGRQYFLGVRWNL